MVEITLLGPVSVAVSGEPLTGEAAQRRRLAVLALLCTHPPRPVARDQLMGCLWPQSDGESARHLLSVAIHVLRKALGPEVIRSNGDQLELDPDLVRVDVNEFEAACEQGDHERAVSLYKGPFLDGLVISGTAEFEHWVDGRRTRLRQRYGTALEGVAATRAADGDGTGAVAAWRRLAALDPYSARTTVGLMRALVEAGNRAGALQAARIHEQLLESEFGAVPDPQVTELAEELRQEPPAPAPGAVEPETVAAPEPPVGPPGESPGEPRVAAGADAGMVEPSRGRRRLTVLAAMLLLLVVSASLVFALRTPPLETVAVLPFDLIGPDPSLDYLGDGMALGILDELGRVPELQVISRASSFSFRDSGIDAMSVGQRLNAQALITGSVRVMADTLRVDVELFQTKDGLRLWDGTFYGRRSDIFSLEDRIAEAVGTVLRVRIAGAEESGRGQGRRDAVAHDLFLRGRHAWNRRTPEALLEALTLFQRAVDQDPTYAWAHVGIADTYNLLGSYDYGVLPPDSAFPPARAAAREALALEGSLAPAHAALANVKMNYERDWAGAESTYRQAMKLDPSYTPARQWLANLLIAQVRMEEAHALLLRALEYDPESPLMFTSVAHYHYFAREPEAALRLIDRALEISPTFVRALLLRTLVLLQTERLAEAIADLEAMAAQAGGSDPVLAAVLGHAYGRAGRTDDALAELAWLRSIATTRHVPSEWLALVHIGLGDHDAALDRLEEALERRSAGVIYLRMEPLVDPLRPIPRFQGLLARIDRTGPPGPN